MSHKYHFESKSTKFYVISTNNDKPGDIVRTANGAHSVPPHSVLTVNPTHLPGIVTITGVTGLYVSLNGGEPYTKLTWSHKEYTWQIKATPEKIDYIIPGNGLDLYWFDSFSIGAYVVVKPGKDIKPPDSEWILKQA